jgi:hypothetical protein
MLVAVGSLEPLASDVHHNDPGVRERILYGNDTYSLMVSRAGADVVRLEASQSRLRSTSWAMPTTRWACMARQSLE